MSSQKPFAVFDIDGTLIRWQLYHAVVDRLAKKNLLGPKAHDKLHDARMVWKRREHPEAFRVYEMALIEVYEESLPRLTPKVFDKVVDEVAAEYKEQVYTYTRDLVNRLKSKGYVLLAISGSHQELVAHVANQYGFDDCVGTLYHRNNEAFTGSKFVASKNKRAVLEGLVKKHGLDYKGSVGVGDSKSDAAFLEMVQEPIAFNPDRDLFAIAKQSSWKLVIERKNMVYKLEPKNGTYLLAKTNA
jgi:HAD superfamily hydrolase (TIGR01490 family)